MSPSRMRRIHSSTPSTARWKDHSSTVGEHTEHGAMKMTAIVAIAVMGVNIHDIDGGDNGEMEST